MATYTTNLNLKKPATSDKIRIADFNNNADLIDAGYGDQDTSMGKLGGGMAIISTGNVHAAITAGQFVYVRKHSTLAEGLYTADSNVSANGTLSTSNLTAVSGGGLNVLNGILPGLNLTKTSISDANADLDNGIYYTTSGTSNTPATNGCLFNIKSGGSAARRMQFYMNSSNLWFRFGSVSSEVLTWGSWYLVTATAVT